MFKFLLMVYVPTNSFQVADKKFLHNTSKYTDLIYQADLDILCYMMLIRMGTVIIGLYIW